MSQKVLYLYGKAGFGKTAVALKICEKLCGRVQAAAVTGKAAALLMHLLSTVCFNGMRAVVQHLTMALSS